MTIAAMLERRGTGGLSMLDIQDDRAAYEMPPVRTAMMVMYYPSAQEAGGGSLAWVTHLYEGGKTIGRLYVPLGSPRVAESVPHLTDPVLRLGGAHAEAGAWGHTEEHVEQTRRAEETRKLIKEVAELRALVEQIHKANAKKAQGTKEPKPPNEYETRYQEAIAKGFAKPPVGRPKRQEIEDFLKENTVI